MRIVLPERADDELEELMKKWRDEQALRSRRPLSMSHRLSGRPAVTTLLGARALVDLLVDRLGHALEPLAVVRAAHHVGKLVVDPVERGETCPRSCSAARVSDAPALAQ